MENLFTCLSTVLLQKENQRKFLTCEGMELMIRCLNERKYAAGKYWFVLWLEAKFSLKFFISLFTTYINRILWIYIFPNCILHVHGMWYRKEHYKWYKIILNHITLSFFLLCKNFFRFSACALRAISYAVSNNKSCCQKFISSGGLKLAFPVLIGRGLPKPKKKSSRKGEICNWFYLL